MLNGPAPTNTGPVPLSIDAIRAAFEKAIRRYRVDPDAAWECAAAARPDLDGLLTGLAAAAMRDLAIIAGPEVDAAYVAALDRNGATSLVECFRVAVSRWPPGGCRITATDHSSEEL